MEPRWIPPNLSFNNHKNKSLLFTEEKDYLKSNIERCLSIESIIMMK